MESGNDMDSAQPAMGELQSSSPAPTAPLTAPPAAPPPTPTAPPAPTAPIISNNAEGFKYKYPEAKPTPPGVDDAEWNRTYTAADSRKYNYAGKNHKESRKFRQSGETRELALKMLAEKQAKAAEQAKGGGTQSRKASKPSAPKQKIETTPSTTTRDATPAGPSLSISEQIKSEGRARKAVSVAPSSSSNQGTPAPTPTTTGPKMSPAKSKKGTATTIKKPPKKAKNQGRMGTPSSSKGDSQTPGPKAAAGEDGEDDGDSDSNDGGEYCICRGPDDHRMMVYCEGGCDDWYHCSCMGMDVEDARELLDTFICPQCKTEEKFTLWKRMCRCYTIPHMKCRKAARVTATPPSLYCSDEHKDDFWKHVATIARQDNEPSKGGVLNIFEISDLVHQVKTKAGMDALGQKPRLPKPEGADPSRPAGLDHLTQEEEQTIAKFKAKQEKNKAQIDGLRGQLLLLKLVNDRNKIANQHPDAKGKAYCGYDSRLSFNGPQFARWKESTEGKTALETKVLGPRTNETKGIDSIILMDGEVAPTEPVVADVLKSMCLNPKKKCPQHRDWYKVHEEDFHFSSKNLKDENAKLQRKIDEIVDDAETREATKEDEAHNVTIQLF